MTVKRVSLKVSPEAALRVATAREPSFVDLVEAQPLVVLGSARTPDIISPSIAPSAQTCFGPRGACLTSMDGPLWICDTGHHRLLGWRTMPVSDTTPADWLIGQKDFESEGRNGKGEIGPTTVNVPTGICTVGEGLAVSDAWNHRILIWHKVPKDSHVPADIVLGQPDFQGGEANRGADHPRADTMHWPYGVHSHDGKLLVADTGNRRVLIWNTIPSENGQKADCVLGQVDFATRDENAGAEPSAMSMRWPHAIAFWQHKLCVSDAGNNRILTWNECPSTNGAPADFMIGQANSEGVDFNQSFYWPRANTLNMPYGMTAADNWLIVADTANSRMLGWRQNHDGVLSNASALFGQKDFHEKGDNRWQPIASDSICWPYGVQALNGLLVVSDSGNNRVSIWKLAIDKPDHQGLEGAQSKPAQNSLNTSNTQNTQTRQTRQTRQEPRSAPCESSKPIESSESSEPVVGWTIRVRGTVQGVGFRPTVYSLANQHNLKGSVLNDGEGVLIQAWGTESQLTKFIQELQENPPPLARIESLDHERSGGTEVPVNFVITKSETTVAHTNISPDATTCHECREEIFSPFSRRFRYPFTNCTHCGPRLSIIKSIPYDRAFTSMFAFPMCAECQKEYDDPTDRRFHAQPNACHACGPKAWLERSDGRTLCIESMTQLDQVDAAATLIQRGEIVAIKGIGGFHLACDATNEEAVAKLRRRKLRYDKPFALMARDIDIVKKHCLLSDTEHKLLVSASAPIVVLDQIPQESAKATVAPSVSPGQHNLGFMLPYTPLHHLLMKRLSKPIVLTSGNRAHEPQSISNDEAKERLGTMADYLLLNDRDIINRLDDSVVRVICGEPTYLRRARGLAPAPIPLPQGFENAPDVLAMGAELKNTFCLIKNSKAIVSQHIGDLEDAKTYADYKTNLELYRKSFQHVAQRIAVDLHPEYLSSKLGREEARQGNLPLDDVQHHHAHIASCMADNLWSLDAGPVLGIALDGLGYGCDGTFWGGEFLLADYTGFERLGTFKPVALIGGTQAMREPWRNTYAHLMAEMGWPRFKMDFEDLELTTFFESKPLVTLNSMLKSQINSPLASSCGRLFDAVAAAMGICRENISYEGQAACELEAIVCHKTLKHETENLGYPFAVPRLGGKGLPYIEPLAVWQAVLGDLLLKTDKGVMSARFHKGLAKAIVHLAKKLCTRDDERWLNTVALSGGVFQNKILQEQVFDRLEAEGFNVLIHHQVPANDGGLSLGQAVISAASQMQTNKERSHVSWHTWSNS